MKNTIMEKYNDLYEDIQMKYNKITIMNLDKVYTIFYLNKNDSFEKFQDTWLNFNMKNEEYGYSYDEIIDLFYEQAGKDFDYFELGTVNVYTDCEYTLYL